MTHQVCQHLVEHLLLLGTISCRSNAGRYDDDNQRNPITSHKQVEVPDCGIEDLNHHTVQLDSFQQHPHKGSQEEEMEHHSDKPAATLSEDQQQEEAFSSSVSAGTLTFWRL